jgi:hypothetical protein
VAKLHWTASVEIAENLSIIQQVYQWLTEKGSSLKLWQWMVVMGIWSDFRAKVNGAFRWQARRAMAALVIAADLFKFASASGERASGRAETISVCASGPDKWPTALWRLNGDFRASDRQRWIELQRHECLECHLREAIQVSEIIFKITNSLWNRSDLRYNISMKTFENENIPEKTNLTQDLSIWLLCGGQGQVEIILRQFLTRGLFHILEVHDLFMRMTCWEFLRCRISLIDKSFSIIIGLFLSIPQNIPYRALPCNSRESQPHCARYHANQITQSMIGINLPIIPTGSLTIDWLFVMLLLLTSFVSE